jgi:hypothetical protein
VPVEEPKPAAERGTYLHPEVFNQPEEKSIDAARRADINRQVRDKPEPPLPTSKPGSR